MWSVPVEPPSENFSATSSTVKLLAVVSGTTRVAELKESEKAGSTASARRLPGAVVATAVISPGRPLNVYVTFAVTGGGGSGRVAYCRFVRVKTLSFSESSRCQKGRVSAASVGTSTMKPAWKVSGVGMDDGLWVFRTVQPDGS